MAAGQIAPNLNPLIPTCQCASVREQALQLDERPWYITLHRGDVAHIQSTQHTWYHQVQLQQQRYHLTLDVLHLFFRKNKYSL